MEQHVADLADAYALGALDELERVRVEAHLASCPRCTRAVGEAEEVVARLVESTTPLVEPPASLGARIAASARRAGSAQARRPWGIWAALAAALLLSLGVNAGLLRERTQLSAIVSHNDTVLATIATSHFKHQTLNPQTADAPVAKILYAPDRSWFYVIVDTSDCRCHIVAGSAGNMRDVGAPEPGGRTSTLFKRGGPFPEIVNLQDSAGHVIASAHLE